METYCKEKKNSKKTRTTLGNILPLETDLNRVSTNVFKILNHKRRDRKETVNKTCFTEEQF